MFRCASSDAHDCDHLSEFSRKIVRKKSRDQIFMPCSRIPWLTSDVFYTHHEVAGWVQHRLHCLKYKTQKVVSIRHDVPLETLLIVHIRAGQFRAWARWNKSLKMVVCRRMDDTTFDFIAVLEQQDKMEYSVPRVSWNMQIIEYFACTADICWFTTCSAFECWPPENHSLMHAQTQQSDCCTYCDNWFSNGKWASCKKISCCTTSKTSRIHREQMVPCAYSPNVRDTTMKKCEYDR